jgi:hypothetical protein
LNGLRGLPAAGCLGFDLREVDDCAAVPALSNDAGGIFGPHVEPEEFAFAAREARVTAKQFAHRRRRKVFDLDGDADGNLSRLQ